MKARVVSGELKLSYEHDAYHWVSDEALRRLDLAEPLTSALKAAHETDPRS